jgi:hypothetical protein
MEMNWTLIIHLLIWICDAYVGARFPAPPVTARVIIELPIVASLRCVVERAARLQRQFVYIAPEPIFSRLERLHDGVLGGVEMLCGVLIL